jgi:hypothetical protein
MARQRLEIFCFPLSNSPRPFDYKVKAGNWPASQTTEETTMPQFLVAGYIADDFDPSQMDPAAGEKIHTLNREMIAAGVRKFAGGLGATKTVRAQKGGGGARVTDGPYLETKEHIGGLWILECQDMDEAVAWAKKGVAAIGGDVEVREIFFVPAPEEN